MVEKFNLTDESAREKIIKDLDKTFYVEAGAGTGKTTSLVQRIVAIVLSGKAKLQEIAAITFTEAAAAELKSRIREELDEYSVKITITNEDQSKIIEALKDIDKASIQTLHSFAANLIRQFPIQSGITPGFDILDEFEDETLFNEFLKTWFDSKMADDRTAQFFKILIALDAPVKGLKQVGDLFWKNYDLLDEVNFPNYSPPKPPKNNLIDKLQEELLRLIELAKYPDEDLLYAHVMRTINDLPMLHLALSSKYSGLYMCSNFSDVFLYSRYRPTYKLTIKRGRQEDWEEDNVTGINGCKLIKEVLDDFSEMVDEYVIGWAKHAMMPLIEDLKGSILNKARQRKIDGKLIFHDLLIQSRNLIRDNLEIRNTYKKIYKYILIDEFQDTDPIQAEIATFLCEDLFTDKDSSLIEKDWKNVITKTGKMFAVGDPKQSIFKFRRADVSVADTIKNQIADEEIYLTNNFRSQETIIKWVNKVFGSIIKESENQPAYIPLEVGSSDLDLIHPKKVKYFGAQNSKAKAAILRGAEAFDVPRIIARAVTEKWLVRDPKLEGAPNSPKVRPIKLNDICILAPTRYGLSDLLLELEDVGLPYRLESSFSVYSTQEIYDLLNCLKAINNPKDYVSVIAALKSQIFGCSDRDIAMHQELGGSLNFSTPVKTSVESIVDGFGLLNRLYLDKGSIPVTRLIEKLIRERGTLIYSLSKKWPREQWRKYQLIIDKARILNENNSLSLTFFIDWLEDQIINGVRSFDSTVPDADENSIRVMTIHASKGLEFPLVFLVGITGSFAPIIDSVIFGRDDGQIEVALTKELSTEGYKNLKVPEQAAFLEERKRLLYVATTRARDYLIISAYGGKGSQSQWFSNALERENQEEYWEEIVGIDPDEMIANLIDNNNSIVNPSTKKERQSWLEKHIQSLKLSSIPATITATGLVNELKEESFMEDEPWRKGRAGTKIGRAVHSILQTVDLSGNTEIQPIIDSQAKIEGVIEFTETIKLLVENAINSDIIKRAIASNRIWREVPVMAPIDGQAIEGIIDLVFEENGELVIVDYKTDHLQTQDEIQQAVDNYRLQLAAYAYAVSKSTGKNVKEAGLALLYPNQFILMDKTLLLEEDLKIAVEKWVESVSSK